MNNDQKLATLFSMLMVVSSATLGWFSFSDRALPSRIADTRTGGSGVVSEQDVLARLWEDPIQAVAAEASKHEKDSTHQMERLQNLIRTNLMEARVGILLVPVPGAPFADDAETRLRLRYCIQMALAEAAFAPEDRDHLGFVVWNRTSTNSVPLHGACPNARTNSEAGPVNLPYEWFVPRSTNTNLKILLLWIPEEVLGSHPLCRLAGLREQLVPSLTTDRFTGMFLIGPRASDTLKAMLQPSPGTSNNHGCNISLRDKFSIFSPESTAPDSFVGLQANRAWPQARTEAEERLKLRLGGTDANWRYFHNFIAPDDQLTDLLVQELALRRVVLKGDQPDTVLVLAEADTSYGRALPLAFQASLEKHLQNSLSLPHRSETPSLLKSLAEHSEPAPSNLVMVRYLRGLDRQKGYQTGTAANQGALAKSTEEAFVQALTPTASPATGESQLDYTERLGTILAERIQHRKVKAVGVLGSDLYDKLILLRTLRNRFPEAVFFSTDLDAQLWHPQNYRFTRNLVIASAYGLEDAFTSSNDGGSQPFTQPPFRDSYQVGVFKACRAAILKASVGQNQFDTPPQPHLYEIALAGAVRLSDPFIGGPQYPSRWRTLIPQGRQWIGIALLGLAGSGMLWLATQMNRRFMNHQGLTFGGIWKDRSGYVGFCAMGVLAALALLFGLSLKWSELPRGEPWHFGITVWPTELIRLLSVGLVVWMFLWAWQRHLRHRERLSNRYALPLPQPARLDWTSAYDIVFQDGWPKPSQDAIDATAVFQCYVNKAHWRPRTIRVLIGMTIYLLLGFGMMFLAGLPLNTHIRGEHAWQVDQAMLYASIFALLALIFFVLDSVWLSAQMLNRIAEPNTIWPEESEARRDIKQLRARKDDIEGHLDVDFAAVKTRETGRLLLLPFLIQFLMLFSRNSYFDNWSWPITLNAILITNMLMAAVAWAILRRAAANVRREALKKLEGNLLEAKCDEKRPTAGGTALSTPSKDADSTAAASSPPPAPSGPFPAERVITLIALRERILEEHRGAYARWIQDPAFIALLIPTGLTGVLTLLFRALFGGL